ncbi:hypothetical protein MTBBW1_340059 [Desulfamplus magnetovallimortis]|uniref:HD-GYP domain-containing protein n=1 Tax=Desulfamplus magnetovallimortis TaxID=1246637 RepID=A0A1W1HG94_9BACT|nr:HD domain-containing phosphohydrolase [Desulfamplus magnetovallimortis]SLM31507.1 hypothetical protein MTBBW1_340059 [Desulfamplus magnetovallimortis]
MTIDYKTCFNLFSEISRAIHSGSKSSEILMTIVKNITVILDAKGSIYWIINRDKKKIETMISHGFTYRSLAETDYRTLAKIFEIEPDTDTEHSWPTDATCEHENNDISFHGKKEVFIEDARNDERIPNLERLGKQRVGSVTAMFFDIDGPYTGILAVYFTGRKKLAPLEKELVTALGEQGAIALQKALSYDEEMIAMFRQVVEGFALALEAKDSKTHGHSIKVADLAKLTAIELELPRHETDTIFHAALLHDIGKIGMEDNVLERLGKLNFKEMEKAKEHPVTGARIVKALPMFKGIEPLILYHHERFDGSGYPEKLKGENIPLGARIIAVCDVFETMITGRPNLKKMSIPDAIKGIEKSAGILFDPCVVKAFMSAVEKNPQSICPSKTASVEKYLRQLQKSIETISNAANLKKKFSKKSVADIFPIGF